MPAVTIYHVALGLGADPNRQTAMPSGSPPYPSPTSPIHKKRRNHFLLHPYENK
jgi:hypothetical protein